MNTSEQILMTTSVDDGKTIISALTPELRIDLEGRIALLGKKLSAVSVEFSDAPENPPFKVWTIGVTGQHKISIASGGKVKLELDWYSSIDLISASDAFLSVLRSEQKATDQRVVVTPIGEVHENLRQHS